MESFQHPFRCLKIRRRVQTAALREEGLKAANDVKVQPKRWTESYDVKSTERSQRGHEAFNLAPEEDQRAEEKVYFLEQAD